MARWPAVMARLLGFLGGELWRKTIGKGVQVRAVTRDPRKAKANQLPNVHFVQGDFEDADSMRRACSDVDRAFLLPNSTERADSNRSRARIPKPSKS